MASTPLVDRAALRLSLRADRDRFSAGPDAAALMASLGAHLSRILTELDPEILGMYWPIGSEFNALSSVSADTRLAKVPLALPFSHRSPVQMEYRRWDGRAPVARDECGIPCSGGAVVVPDVVLVPCLGFTADGHRLGHGGGYFDRWLARHPATTTVGIAWSTTELATGTFQALAHDQPLTLIVTERGVVT